MNLLHENMFHSIGNSYTPAAILRLVIYYSLL